MHRIQCAKVCNRQQLSSAENLIDLFLIQYFKNCDRNLKKNGRSIM